MITTPPEASPSSLSLEVSPSRLYMRPGSSSAPIQLALAAPKAFTGTVELGWHGLPVGTVIEPAQVVSVAAGKPLDVRITLPQSVAPGATIRASIGGTIDGQRTETALDLVVVPPVRAYESGSHAFLERVEGNDSSRIGLDLIRGAAVVEASLNGKNVVNAWDAGREIQVAFYDGNDRYDECSGCQHVWGWDPVQAGDRHEHGSTVLAKYVGPDSIFARIRPNQWYPDDKGGGVSAAVPSEMVIEQSLSAVRGIPRAYRLHYRVQYHGAVARQMARQEFPAVYVNREFKRLVLYDGPAPFTGGTVSELTPPLAGSVATYFAAEQWAAYVNDADNGITVWAPGGYGTIIATRIPPQPNDSAFGAQYFAHGVDFAFSPGSELQGEIFLILGNYQEARASIAALRARQSFPDYLPPRGSLDVPTASSSISGDITIAGWTYDNVGLANATLWVDDTFVGALVRGRSRSDVMTALPGAPRNAGFEGSLDTRRFPDGPHKVRVRATDTSGNVAEFTHPITILNGKQ